MIPEIDEYLIRAKAHTLACKEYTLRIQHATTKKDVFDIALEVQSVEFLVQSIIEGWGLSSEQIVRLFGSYLNGLYKRDCGGYTSSMYCQYKGEISPITTLLCVIDSDVVIDIPQYKMCKLYVCGESKVKVKGMGTVFIDKQDEKSVVEYV